MVDQAVRSAPDETRDAGLIAERTHKRLIGIAVLTAQTEIAMRHDKIHLGFQQQIRQNHRIHAATEGQNEFVALGNQVIPINICLELVNHVNVLPQIFLCLFRSPERNTNHRDTDLYQSLHADYQI